MRILDRYLLKNLLIPILYCCFALVFLMLTADLFDKLDDLLSHRTPLGTALIYYLNLIPFSFTQISSWAFFLGTLYLLVNFNTHNEILAMKASGIAIAKIILPILFAGFVMGIITFLVNDRIVPVTLRKAINLQDTYIKRETKIKTDETVIPHVTYYSTTNRLYYAKALEVKEPRLRELIILFFDDSKKVHRKIFAKEAVWREEGWILKNVTDYDTTAQGRMIGEPRIYQEKSYPEISETPQEFVQAASESVFLSFQELKGYIKKLKENGLKAYAETVELNYKLSFPWHPLVMILMLFPLLTTSNTRKIIAFNVLVSILLVFSFHVLGAVTLAMGKAGHLPPFLSAWMNSIALSLGSLFFLDRANF